MAFRIEYGENVCGAFLTDRTRLCQIISNLVSNAIKFTETGEIVIRVDVAEGVSPDDPCDVRINVRDTGTGFSEEVASRLFIRFEQAESAMKSAAGGSGLGLSICRAVAQAMGGEVTARSTPGEGSVFEVRLPLVRSASAPEGTASEMARGGGRAPGKLAAGEAVHVLLVEDNLVNQQVMRLLLEPLGATLEIAKDGLEAIDSFKNGRFDLILMDMQMPVLDGLHATRAIRLLEFEERRVRTPIVMVSANAMPDHVNQAHQAGCDLHLSKPFTPSMLAESVAKALEMGSR